MHHSYVVQDGRLTFQTIQRVPAKATGPLINLLLDTGQDITRRIRRCSSNLALIDYHFPGTQVGCTPYMGGLALADTVSEVSSAAGG